jgi:hypothetical protein
VHCANFGKTHTHKRTRACAIGILACVRCACGRKSSVRMCVRVTQKIVATHSLEFFEKLFGNVLDFVLEILVEFFGRNFWEEFLGGIFGEDFFGRIFWEDFFGRIFLGGIFREEFFGRNSLLKLKSAKLFEY